MRQHESFRQRSISLSLTGRKHMASIVNTWAGSCAKQHSMRSPLRLLAQYRIFTN